jgi:hypothetical protein
LLDEHSSIVGKEVETQAELGAVPGPAFRIGFRSIDSLATSPEKNVDRRKRIVRLRREPLMSGMHKTIEPTGFSILYFGTPVTLISTMNLDGTANLAPMSSAWWLGWSCMLGLGQMGQTSDNLIRSRECVINLPSDDLVTHVDRLALTTGKAPVPDKKLQWG